MFKLDCFVFLQHLPLIQNQPGQQKNDDTHAYQYLATPECIVAGIFHATRWETLIEIAIAVREHFRQKFIFQQADFQRWRYIVNDRFAVHLLQLCFFTFYAKRNTLLDIMNSLTTDLKMFTYILSREN